ncbi:hypothetical protein DFQ28_001447 [Apophysomyces sp. BC1034]|nr:hypothetical protein DFQ29_000951 [Apophysomyces sp. BC1021]KAG0190859.1 hypothetical protein DFQ28_001447 [Apophysomyces sp. BC1034]
MKNSYSFPPYAPRILHAEASASSSATSFSDFLELEEQESSNSFCPHVPQFELSSLCAIPLTEENLQIHTNTYSSATKTHYIETFVESQVTVLEREKKLEQRRRAEIRSMIPLDTEQLDEHIIQENVVKPRRWLHKLVPRSFAGCKKKRRTVNALSYEQYQQEKTSMIHYGLHGLSNANLAYALCGAQQHLASLLFPTMNPPQSPKRDSGITLLAKPPSLSINSTQSKSRGVRRWSLSSRKKLDSEFLALRYPKMVRMQALREAAIQILSMESILDEELGLSADNISDIGMSCCCDNQRCLRLSTASYPMTASRFSHCN